MAARLSTFRIDGIQRPMSRICLGTSLIGSGMPRDQSFAMLDAFAARGGTFIDTALVYASTNAGRTVSSEESLGAWMGERGMRETMVVATKGGHPTHGSTRRAHLRPEEIGIDIERSRGRLGLEAIDLYYLHRDDPAVPVDEVLTALEDHRRAGRIRAYAASHWSAARLAAAADAARRRSWPGFSASQIGWSLAEVIPARIPLPNLEFMDAAALAFHRASGMPVIPFSCQAGGFFAKAEEFLDVRHAVQPRAPRPRGRRGSATRRERQFPGPRLDTVSTVRRRRRGRPANARPARRHPRRGRDQARWRGVGSAR